MYEQIESHIEKIPYITPRERAKLREACAKNASLDRFGLDPYDRERLRILSNEAAYKRRVQGQMFSGPAFDFAARHNYFDSYKPVMKPIRLPIVIILITTLVTMQSCGHIETGPHAGSNKIEIGKTVVTEGYSVEILEIDSCEYVAYCIGSQTGLLTHKGNCKNPIHCCK